MKTDRIRLLKEGKDAPGPMIYWMSRDQRAHDNWALFFSQDLAFRMKSPLAVVFCMIPEFLGATIRQYDFMLKGLQETEQNLWEKNIRFFLLSGSPTEQLPKSVARFSSSTLVTDFDPLRIKRNWKKEVMDRVKIPVYEVDTHNIIPCWVGSPKQEFAAYTFRPKVKRRLAEFLEKIPP
jgi:deoxyribodipyrimidine photo-lyase